MHESNRVITHRGMEELEKEKNDMRKREKDKNNEKKIRVFVRKNRTGEL